MVIKLLSNKILYNYKMEHESEQLECRLMRHDYLRITLGSKMGSHVI